MPTAPGGGGKSSRGLADSYTDAEALAALLAGTGLEFRFTSADTVTIAAPGGGESVAAAADGSIVLEEVNVTAWVDSAASGAGGRPFRAPPPSAACPS